MSNGPQKVTDPIFVNPPSEGLLNNAKEIHHTSALQTSGSRDLDARVVSSQCVQKCLRRLRKVFLDERQITHLICARLKYDLYDFFRVFLGAFYTRKRKEAGPKHPLKKSY